MGGIDRARVLSLNRLHQYRRFGQGEVAMSPKVHAILLIPILIAAIGCGGGSRSTPGNKTGGSPGPSGPPTASLVSITPNGDTIRIGGQRQFAGWDSSVGQFDVTWSLQEGAAGGTITADGLYIAPGTPGTFHLIATSSHDSSLSATATVAVVSVGFATANDMGSARSGHTATALADGTVLVAGGTTDAAHSAELFVPSSSIFKSTGAMVHARTGHCSSLLSDGRVLIAGGVDGSGVLIKTAEIFDPATQTFTDATDLNGGRRGASCTTLASGKILIAGGHDSGDGYVLGAELYDASAGKFQVTGDMHSPRAQHAAIRLASGEVLLIAGDSEGSSAELFDPARGIFLTTGSLIQARAHASATLLSNGKVLVLGGTHTVPPVGGGAAPAPVSLDSAEIYDPATGAFQTAGKLLNARDAHSATLLANRTVLVAGGYVHGFDGDADPEWFTITNAEVFDPDTLSSTRAASLEVDRAEHVATLLSDGNVLITGGIEGFQELCCRPKPQTYTLASAEAYK